MAIDPVDPLVRRLDVARIPASQAIVSLARRFSFNLNINVGTHPKCATDLWCNARKCAEQSDPGETCIKDEQCKAGKTCHNDVCGDAGDSELGGSCKDNDDCKNGLYCLRSSGAPLGTCETKTVDGTACTSSVQSCKGRCDRPDGGTNGTCKSLCGSG